MYDHIRVVMCQKPLQNPLIFEKWENFENGQIGQNAWALAHAKLSVWLKKVKMPKTCEKWLYGHIRVVVCKKPLKKTPIILKMRAF